MNSKNSRIALFSLVITLGSIGMAIHAQENEKVFSLVRLEQKQAAAETNVKHYCGRERQI